jgi:hypothetical protein
MVTAVEKIRILVPDLEKAIDAYDVMIGRNCDARIVDSQDAPAGWYILDNVMLELVEDRALEPRLRYR